MAEKRNKKEEFDTAVYELGITLIENYRTGNCRDSDKLLTSIIEIFKVSQRNAGHFLLEGKKNGV